MKDRGLASSRLVFGIIPRVPLIRYHLPQHKKQKKALDTAQAKMNSIIAKSRAPQALTKIIPLAASQNNTFGKEVLGYSNLKKEWAGLKYFMFKEE